LLALPDSMKKQHLFFWVRLAGAVLFGSLVVGLVLLSRRHWSDLTPQELARRLSEFRSLALLGMLGLWMVRPLGLAIPMSVMSLAGGYLFGGPMGALLNIAGINLGALCAFKLARGLGREIVEALVGTWTERYLRGVHRHPIETLLFLRLMPIFSFTAVCALSGVMRIRLRDYMLGTALGAAPAAVVYAFCGDYLRHGTAAMAWFVVGFSVFMVLLPVALYGVVPPVRDRINAILCLEGGDGEDSNGSTT